MAYRSAEIQGGKASRVDALRRTIRRMEGYGAAATAGVLPLGLPEVDAALPDGGLPLGCLHEILAEPSRPGDAAADGFAAALLARLAARRHRAVLWLAAGDPPYAPGVTSFGLPPDRLVVARVPRPADRLWALEETARSGAVAAVLAEADRLDLTAGRRLQLAAEAGGTTLLVLRRRCAEDPACAAVSRWRVVTAPGRTARLGDGAPLPGTGHPRWRLDLRRCRGGRPGSWSLMWLGPAAGWCLDEDTADTGAKGKAGLGTPPTARPGARQAA